ncbi:MAG: SusC/RagA family TonB-linked outer membrane protein, partial [Bacteroidota bacterium]
MEILKDASATAIYGARGANGVILVTTKRGKANQKPQVEFSLRTGTVSPNSKYDISTDPEEIGLMIWLEQTNDGIDPAHAHFTFTDAPTAVVNDFLFPNGASNNDPAADISLYNQQDYPITRSSAMGTDWLDVIYQNGLTQDYNISITGGSENTQYGFMGNFLEEEGMLQHTQFTRYSIRSNVSSKLTKWLRIGENLGVAITENRGYNSNNNNGVFRLINEVSPLIPVYDEGNNFAGGVVGGALNDGPNPLGQLSRLQNNWGRNFGITGNFFGEISPINGLTVKTLFGYNINNAKNFSPRFPDWENTNGARSVSLSEGSSNNITWNWSNTISYSRTFNEMHDLNVLAGVEARRTTARWLFASRDGFFSDELEFLVLDAGETNQQNGSSGFVRATASQFGRIQYGFQSKYLFDATLRRDGSSVLGTDKYGVFPAFSVAWRISEEAFMPKGKWLNDLKLRASWGQSGNDQTNNPYNSFSTFSSGLGNSFYAIDGSDNNITLGYQSRAIGNPDAKWETTTTSNIAVDATLFDGLDVTVDLWNKNTEDMLFNVQIPAVVGVATPPAVNIGSMTNTGIDITLDYRGQISQDIGLNVATTFTTYKNQITELSGLDNDFLPGRELRGQTYTRAQTGRSFPEFYGYVVDGIFQTEEEANAHAPNGTYNQPGNLIIRDVDGDGEITPDDRTFIGNPNPDFTAGLRLGLDFKGFDLTATFYTMVGHDIVNYTARFRRYG